ncbi:MAG: hypothetical protein KDB10_05410 [Acidimicrobiales bacterium]|nr:hypothetical protein [Acidimicrobiales bacterium]
MAVAALLAVADPAGGSEPPGATFGGPAPSATATAPRAANPDRATFLAGTDPSPPGGPEASRAITVTPDTDLVDGQIVTVDGTGFGADGITGIFACAKGLGLDGCDADRVLIFQPPGDAFSRELRVDPILDTTAGEIDCRSHAAGCRLAANDHYSLAGAAVAGIAFDPSAPLEPPPTVAVDPANDLVDGQVVRVTGSGFRADELVLLGQCADDDTDLTACANQFSVAAAADGTIDEPFQVAADLTYFDPGAAPSVPPAIVDRDCRIEGCDLVAVALDGFDRAGRVPLSFDPDAPLRPDMTITVTPDGGLVDGQVVEVAATGMTPRGPVDVVECSITSDLDGNGCELDRAQHLVAGDDGSLGTTYAVNDRLDTASGPVDCRTGGCILVAVDRSVPIAFGRGYVFATLSFGDPFAPVADPRPVPPAFTG